MKALLLYPRFPKTFWSYDRFMEMASLKATIPPLGIITVAALLPQDWEIRFCDRNVTPETDADWEWCDIVILSAMLAQKADFHAMIRKAVQLGKKVAVGGPYPTSVPQDALDCGADYLILDEGELTVPMFLEAIAQNQPHGIFRATEKPDVTLSPTPRFDLLQRDQYLMMAIQFSRGCPFNCEFCDIISLYGRKPRTKSPEQLHWQSAQRQAAVARADSLDAAAPVSLYVSHRSFCQFSRRCGTARFDGQSRFLWRIPGHRNP
jgi:radical SAM superfamily enzyme YgiQ (UPF0313 family)